MPRWTSRTCPVLLWSLLATLLAAGSARAHRLDAQCFALPGHKVQVESWFDLDSKPARGAQVQVFRADGSLLTEGQLDDMGIFVFTYEKAETLKVVVNAGAGHRKEVEIRAEQLSKDTAPAGSAKTTQESPQAPVAPVPLSQRTSEVSIKDVLIGVGFLLAVAAFVLSLLNARQLRELKRASLPAEREGS